jgi:hypothetical protein
VQRTGRSTRGLRLEFAAVRRANPHASRRIREYTADVVKLVDTLS